MLTPAQCRAARGFLNWTLADLAAASGLSRASLNAFESGKGNAKTETLARIRYAFEQRGMEFDQAGVRPKQELVRILKGENCHAELMDNIYETLKETGGEVLLSNVDERKGFQSQREKLIQWLDKIQLANITERMLVCEDDTFFLLPESCYRWIDRNMFHGGVMTYIYGDKFAYKIWQEDIIILIENAQIANAERERFEFLWQRAQVPKIAE